MLQSELRSAENVKTHARFQRLDMKKKDNENYFYIFHMKMITIGGVLG